MGVFGAFGIERCVPFEGRGSDRFSCCLVQEIPEFCWVRIFCDLLEAALLSSRDDGGIKAQRTHNPGDWHTAGYMRRFQMALHYHEFYLYPMVMAQLLSCGLAGPLLFRGQFLRNFFLYPSYLTTSPRGFSPEPNMEYERI